MTRPPTPRGSESPDGAAAAAAQRIGDRATARRPQRGPGASLGRIAVIALKELRQVRRDRLTLAMMVVLPLLQLTLFGYAINTDVRHIPTIVFDQDQSAASRDLWRSLEATGFHDVIGQVRNYQEMSTMLRRGDAKVALVIPARYQADVSVARPVKLQLVVDGSDPQTVASAQNAALGLIQSRSIEVEQSSLAAGRVPRVAAQTLEPTVWYNPDLRTAVFIVPGLVGVILTLTMVMLTAMAIARERERGTLEQLIVSPVRRFELILGKIVPYILVGYVQMSLILAAGFYAFGVEVRGSLLLLYFLAALFIAANLALGLVFSTLASTQQQAMQMSIFFLLPNILISGFMFPFEAMPTAVQWLAQGLPLTHFLRIVRGIALKSTGFVDLRPELLWLVGILTGFVAIASLRFQKKLG